MRSLSALCEITDGDIRSCLNTLQFIRGKSTMFNKEMIEHTPLGKKDIGKSLHSVWSDIFNAKNAKKNRAFGATALDENENAYVSRIADGVITNGEYERLMQGMLYSRTHNHLNIAILIILHSATGCFESYPKMKFHDVAGAKIVATFDWLYFYDLINHRSNALHQNGLYGYLPYPLVNFHRNFAGTVAQEHKVEYPKVDYEVSATHLLFYLVQTSSWLTKPRPHRTSWRRSHLPIFQTCLFLAWVFNSGGTPPRKA